MGEDLICYVRVFQNFEGFVPVSNRASHYPEFEGHFIAIKPVTGLRRNSSFMTEIHRMCVVA
jgi:hypothetical protein